MFLRSRNTMFEEVEEQDEGKIYGEEEARVGLLV